MSFLDIGTGSGILAIAAAKLGYAPVRCFDFDPESVRVAKENAAHNGVAHLVKPVRHDLTKLPAASATQYHVVCANLIYDLLIAERDRILNRLRPDGVRATRDVPDDVKGGQAEGRRSRPPASYREQVEAYLRGTGGG